MPSNDASFGLDAISLLTDDHDVIRQLFEKYREFIAESADDVERQRLAEHICALLTVHSTIEEEIFYPAAREVTEDDDLLNQAQVEHNAVNDLIAQIESMDAGDELYDATVTVLGEYVEHHVRKEEDELFPELRNSVMDAEAIGEELSDRKQELLAEIDEDDDEL